MPAVQLSDRDQVNAGNKQPKPPCKSHRMKTNDVILWKRAYQLVHKEIKYRRTPYFDSLRPQNGSPLRDIRQRKAYEKSAAGNQKTGDRTGDRYVKEGIFIQNGRAYPDKRAKCPDHEKIGRRWNKIR